MKLEQRHIQIGVLVVLLIAAIAFWNSVFLYPVKLFVVLLHELSHGLMAIATGGEIVNIEINERIGGLCQYIGGWPILVASAGYLGSMVLGGGIFLISLKSNASKLLAFGIAAGVAVTTVAFVGNLFGIIFGLVFAALMTLFALYLPQTILTTSLQFLGATSCLYALIDIKEDLLTLQPRLTDAAILAGITGIPAIVWAVFWSILALILFFLIMRAAYKDARRKSPAEQRPNPSIS